MKSRTPTLRKAAILIASLDEATATRLLAQMPPQQAVRVRQAAEELDDIDPAEQNQVIEEFRRISPLIPKVSHPGLELDASLAAKLSLPESYEDPHERKNATPVMPANDSAPFRFLHETQPEILTPYLEREHPQTVAVVISHLPPAQAANLLTKLPPALQADVIRRLSNLDDADPEVIKEVERGLEAWVTEQTKNLRRREAGMTAVRNILQAAGTAQREMLANLSRHDEPLVESLTGTRRTVIPGDTKTVPSAIYSERVSVPKTSASNRITTSSNSSNVAKPSATTDEKSEKQLPPLSKWYAPEWTFADVRELADEALPAVFRSAGTNLTVLSLTDASAEFIERLAKQLSGREAKALRKELSRFVPTRLGDVEEAQREIARVAEKLAGLGRIQPPRSLQPIAA